MMMDVDAHVDDAGVRANQIDRSLPCWRRRRRRSPLPVLRRVRCVCGCVGAPLQRAQPARRRVHWLGRGQWLGSHYCSFCVSSASVARGQCRSGRVVGELGGWVGGRVSVCVHISVLRRGGQCRV